MGFRIATNMPAITANRHLSNISGLVARSIERLSSGRRVNGAADDPAGLAIAESFRSQIRSLTQAQNNTAQGIGLARVADTALGEIGDMLIRMRELAVESSSGTLTSAQRSSLSSEFSDLQTEITRIANTTEFNGINPLNDSSLTVNIQVGIDAGANNQLAISGVNATAAELGVNALSIGTSGAASSSLAALDSAISQVGSLRAQFGSAERRLESTSRILAMRIESTSSAESVIRDADVAVEVANLTRGQVTLQAGIAVLAQANQNQSLILKLLQ